MVIVFEDNGQAYRAWKVNYEGLIIASYPDQGFYWIGKYVNLPQNLQAGDYLQYSDTEISIKSKLKFLRHQITSINPSKWKF